MEVPIASQTPPIVQLFQWLTDPLGYMESAARRYGDIFAAPVGLNFQHLVHLSHPQAIQEILTNDTKQLTAPGEFNKIFSPFLGHSSVLMVDGDRHRRQRQLLMPPFHGDRMRAYSQLISDITEQAMSQVTPGKPFSARSMVQSISLNVILSAVFGIDEKERFQQLSHLLNSIADFFISPFAFNFLLFPFLQKDLGAWSPWGRIMRIQQQIDALIYAQIRDRREHYDPERTDILTLLLSARDEAGEPMTDEELHDELLTLLFTGHETTATALAWALYWIHHLPEVHDKLLAELDTLGSGADAIAISRLPYLTAVCQETLRIYPVVILTFPRVAQSPMNLMGYDIEPGTTLVGCTYLTHHREDLYPEPKKFKPERFLERNFSPYEYLPFGGGARRCIGMALAQFEMKVVLGTILSRYQLALVDKRPVRPQRRAVTLAPAGGVKMVFTGQRQRQEQSFLASVGNQ